MNESGAIGAALDRVDGPLKATGQARYAAEFFPSGLTYAVMVQSEMPRARIRIDAAAARRMPGVIAVLTHENAMRLPQKGRAAVHPPAGRVMSLLQDDTVHYNGEPIAVVVAESFEHAVAAARAIEVAYEAQPPLLSFERGKASAYDAQQLSGEPAQKSWGDVSAGLAQAQVRIERTYTTAMEHHNPMEMHATVAHWEGERLSLYDATQYVSGVRRTVAKTLGIAPERIRVIDPYVGGGFGCKGSTWSHVVLAAMAAKAVGRPVKLMLARPQMFGPVGGRPRTEQHVTLAARSDGSLSAIRHAVISHTSVLEDYAEPATLPTRALYACDNGATTQRLVKLNVGVPTFQRAPGEATGTFAIESAMDELAYELHMDPVELRLRNHAQTEPSSGKPWTSKQLLACYREGAQRFGWAKRNPLPGSMRAGNQCIGWGMASATYPAHRLPANASARLLRDGSVIVQAGTQDLGTGTYTIMTQIAAETLGLRPEQVHFELGDTLLPEAPVSGGSMTAASVGPAVQSACRGLREKIVAAATQDASSPLYAKDRGMIAIEDGWLVARPGGQHEALSALAARRGGGALEVKAEAKPPEGDKAAASRSFGAVFCEARVDASGMLRVPRIVAVYSVGRLMNAKTAASQLQGGIVWGLGQALFEHSVLDERYGRFVNGNLAEYHVPVNADIGAIDVSFVDETDYAFSPLGGRGIGEIGITGVAAAVANALFHATGKRVRDLPITLDKLL